MAQKQDRKFIAKFMGVGEAGDAERHSNVLES